MSRRKPPNQQTANRPWIVAALVLIAITAGLALGLALNRPRAATGAQEHPEPQPATPGPLPVKEPTITPEATIPILYRPAASPEARPQLTLEIVVTDAATKQPLLARIRVAGTLAARAKSRQDVILNLSNTKPKAIRIRIEADGYTTWERDVRFKVLYNRRMPLPVELEPVQPPAKSGA